MLKKKSIKQFQKLFCPVSKVIRGLFCTQLKSLHTLEHLRKKNECKKSSGCFYSLQKVTMGSKRPNWTFFKFSAKTQTDKAITLLLSYFFILFFYFILLFYSFILFFYFIILFFYFIILFFLLLFFPSSFFLVVSKK